MKHKQKITWFISGILVASILSTSVLPSAAALVARTFTVYTGINVYVDDVKIDAGDTNGNPDAIAYNGTTYVAVAAISNSLGQNVKWDSSTNSVYIGKHIGSSSYLLNVCPPYQTHAYFRTPTTMNMSGTKYANGMRLTILSGSAYALFNLNGKYDTLRFVVGHIDGETMYSSQLNIYLDGELAFSLDLDPEDMPKQCEVPLNGAIQMKIEGTSWCEFYGIADIQVS